jgi:hypothetical protein
MTTSNTQIQAQSLGVLHSALRLLTSLPLVELPRFVNILTGLATGHPVLFGPHLSDLLSFFSPLILPTPTDPTTARPSNEIETPTAGGTGAFTFPPVAAKQASNGHTFPHRRTPSSSSQSQSGSEDDDDEPRISEEKDEARKATLEFMVSLSEARPGMIRRGGGGGARGAELGLAWIRAIVRGCLEGMAEIGGKLRIWETAEVRDWLKLMSAKLIASSLIMIPHSTFILLSTSIPWIVFHWHCALPPLTLSRQC